MSACWLPLRSDVAPKIAPKINQDRPWGTGRPQKRSQEAQDGINPAKDPKQASKSAAAAGSAAAAAVEAAGKNRKIMFFHGFLNESLAKTRLKTFRQLR